MQRQGRRVAGWLDTWFGPDTLPAVPASAAPSHPATSSRELSPPHEPTPSQESPETTTAEPGVRVGHP
jgi:hypothetical protein